MASNGNDNKSEKKTVAADNNDVSKKKSASGVLSTSKAKKTSKVEDKRESGVQEEVFKSSGVGNRRKMEEYGMAIRRTNSQKESEYRSLNRSYLGHIDNFLKNSDRAREIFASIKSGENTYLKCSRIENSSYDMTWIKAIEDTIPALDKIVKNPRIITKEVAELTPIELVKKTGPESIKHLASHTQYIDDVEKNGDVRPKKILNIEVDDEFHTYENKFIATLIRRLVIFVMKRYVFCTSFAPLKNYDELFVRSESMVDGNKVNMETKVRISKPETISAAKVSKNYLDRVETVLKYTKYYANSFFMRMFKLDKDVRNPIIQTNIIRKNPDYRKCFILWTFLNNYERLGISYRVSHEYFKISDKELDNLDKLQVVSFLACEGRDNEKDIPKFETKVYKPNIITTIDDDVFCYSADYETPEFVRVDQAYRESIYNPYKDLKPNPNINEAEYDKKNYEAKRIIEMDAKRIEELLARKEGAAVEWRNQQQALADFYEKQRKEREAYLLKQENDLLDNILKETRKEIKDIGILDGTSDNEIIRLNSLIKDKEAELENLKKELSEKEAALKQLKNKKEVEITEDNAKKEETHKAIKEDKKTEEKSSEDSSVAPVLDDKSATNNTQEKIEEDKTTEEKLPEEQKEVGITEENDKIQDDGK